MPGASFPDTGNPVVTHPQRGVDGTAKDFCLHKTFLPFFEQTFSPAACFPIDANNGLPDQGGI